MDVAALALNIDSSTVVTATNDLDRFSASATKAGAAGGGYTGSISKLVATVQSMDSKLLAIVGSLDKIARANKTAAASNDNLATSTAKAGAEVAAADAHVIAYTQHLAGLVAAQRNAGIATQQADAHVVAYRTHLDSIANTAPKAAQGVLQLTRGMMVAEESAGALQANTSNIAAQFQDIGVTAAMGMNPLIIGLQQGTQLSAVFAQSGGSMKDVLVGAFRQIASAQALMTIGLVALIALAIQLAASFFSAKNEADDLAKKLSAVEFSTGALGKAQSILGIYMDTTTGKITNQSAALRDLALAQAMVAKVQAQISQQRAQSQMQEITRQRWGVTGGMGGGISTQSFFTPESGIVESFMNGGMKADSALKQLERLKDMGEITADAFANAASAIANYNVETENIKKFDELTRGIGGETGLLQQFITPNKPHGGKTDAEKTADLLRNAQAEVDAETRRAQAVTISARAAAEAEQRAKLVNEVQQKGIPITAGLAGEINRLSKAYADAKIAADIADVMKNASDAMIQQRQALKDDIALIGLQGEALYRARMEQEALNAARAALPRGETLSPEAEAALKAGAASNAQLAQQRDHDKFIQDMIDKSDELSLSLNRERDAIGLTGQAAIAYDFVTEKLVDAKRQHIELSDAEVAAIEAAGKAYAEQRYQIDQTKQALADAREVTKGFMSDWINGIREGGNIFKTFADAVVNSLNRIIDKLLDRTLNSFLDSMFSGSSGGGFLGGILSGGKSSGLVQPQNMTPWEVITSGKNFALGGAFDRAQRFANGGAFTNSIVTSPTLFRFANGAKMGEMGEAGPEAIVPLSRGPDGRLGVASHGGGARKTQVNIEQHYHMEGVMTPNDVSAMVRQGSAAAVQEVKRNLDTYLREWDTDGAVST